MRIVYLHGFASSPNSAKARFFRECFRQAGVEMQVPALDRGDFTHLTITSQLEAIEEAVAARPAVLMGSSLGGYLAALFASTHSEIEKLILLAPAFGFPRRWCERYGQEELDLWKRRDVWPVFHYGAGRHLPLSYQIVEDSLRYEPEPEFSQPALIFHGTRDPVVPVDSSREYATRHSNVVLRVLNSGHELTDVVEEIWSGIRAFLNLPTPAAA
ncbi:MAG TPA: YqiA/YcfP family alpha/beta fold hydrolase [Bryobacteraceae bacterium]